MEIGTLIFILPATFFEFAGFVSLPRAASSVPSWASGRVHLAPC